MRMRSSPAAPRRIASCAANCSICDDTMRAAISASASSSVLQVSPSAKTMRPDSVPPETGTARSSALVSTCSPGGSARTEIVPRRSSATVVHGSSASSSTMVTCEAFISAAAERTFCVSTASSRAGTSRGHDASASSSSLERCW